MDTYVLIEAIYVLEFSIGFDQTGFVRPLRGDLSVNRLQDIAENATDRVEELYKGQMREG